jgi:hypothetical protein
MCAGTLNACPNNEEKYEIRRPQNRRATDFREFRSRRNRLARLDLSLSANHMYESQTSEAVLQVALQGFRRLSLARPTDAVF